MDISLSFDTVALCGRCRLDRGDLATGDDLETAVLISLFTDAWALPDDEIDDPSDPRGCWIDAFEGRMGSRLWELRRQKMVPEVFRRAREYAAESLQWLIDDGVADSIDVDFVAMNPRGLLGLLITIHRGKETKKYQFAWSDIHV